MTEAVLGISRDVFVGVACGMLCTCGLEAYRRLLPHHAGLAFGAALFAFVSGMLVVDAVAGGTVNEKIVTWVREIDRTPSTEASGETGASGASGPSGASGASGPSGASGASGASGPEGAIGADRDGDGVADSVDRCTDIPGTTADGCPPGPRQTAVAALVGGERTSWETAKLGKIVVGGLHDAAGIRMPLTGGQDDAWFTIAANREYATVRGWVGISSQPCSRGTHAAAAIRDGDGRVLWPATGRMRSLRKDATPFRAEIAREDEIVLYARAPRPRDGFCDVNVTNVGWVKTMLVGPARRDPRPRRPSPLARLDS